MFYLLKLYIKDWWAGLPFTLSVVLFIMLWWYILANIRPTQEQIFLHYNIIFGIDLAGAWWKAMLLPIFGVVFFIINQSLAVRWYNSEKFLSRLLGWFGLGIQVLLFCAAFFLVRLNG